jgi:hypothetical protein
MLRPIFEKDLQRKRNGGDIGIETALQESDLGIHRDLSEAARVCNHQGEKK